MAAALFHSAKQIKQHRKAGKLAADTLIMIGEHIRPGVTTEELNRLVHEFTLAHDARPAPLNYGGGRGRPPFPKSVCTSLNEVICHGIPGPTVLQDGDIINVDVTPVLPAKGDSLLGPTTIVPTVLNGGERHNVVPDEATAPFDCRLSPPIRRS